MTFFQLTILLIFSISIFFSDFLFIIFFNNHCDNKNAMKFFNFGKTPTKPIIGVTGPDHGGTAAWLFTALAIWRKNGIPLRLRPADFGYDQSGTKKRTPIKDVADRIDGVVIGGGADVSPLKYLSAEELEEEKRQLQRTNVANPSDREIAREDTGNKLMGFFVYGVRKLFGRRPLSKEQLKQDALARDDFETELIQEMSKRQAPMVCICRGMQLLAVLNGAKLNRDLSQFYTEFPNPYSPMACKMANIDPNSNLHSVLGKKRIKINALHSQAVLDFNGKADEDGHINIVARDDAHVPQAIELEGVKNVIAIQYHPEYLPSYHRHQNIFANLVHNAHEYRKKANSSEPTERDPLLEKKNH